MGKKLHIKKGDNVFVINGEYKGEKGRVLRVFPEENKAIVEGINMVSKHTKPNSQNPKGGIQKQEAPVNLSNLMIADPSSGEPTRIGRRLNNNNIRVRYSKKTGEDID